VPFTYAKNGEVVGLARSRKESPSGRGKEAKGTRESPSGKVKRSGKRTREKRSLSARSSEKASVQRQGANEIVGYVLSTAA